MMPRFSQPFFDEENEGIGEGISPHEMKLSRDIPDLDPLKEEGEDPIMMAGTYENIKWPFFVNMLFSRNHFH